MSRVALAFLVVVASSCGAGSVAPAEPRSAERECADDSDCVFRPEDPCECAPCGTAWRRSVSQQAAVDLLAEIAGRSCPELECPTCETDWRGTEPVCVSGQCTVRHTH